MEKPEIKEEITGPEELSIDLLDTEINKNTNVNRLHNSSRSITEKLCGLIRPVKGYVLGIFYALSMCMAYNDKNVTVNGWLEPRCSSLPSSIDSDAGLH